MEKHILRAKIEEAFSDVFQTHVKVAAPALLDQTVLLETGLDSLGFAILITKLEDSLGFDPFTISDSAYYPKTFGEFVNYYFENMPR